MILLLGLGKTNGTIFVNTKMKRLLVELVVEEGVICYIVIALIGQLLNVVKLTISFELIQYLYI